MKSFILTLKYDNGGLWSVGVTATDLEAAKSMVMESEGCPASAIVRAVEMDTNRKVLIKGSTRYYRAAETKDFVFYVNYTTDDDVIMFRHGGQLVSNNYFACQGLHEAIINKEITNCTHRMKQAIKFILEQEEKDNEQD